MMEKKSILEEGLLEKYVLDELTDSQRSEVETALGNDPALRERLDALELDFEQMAFENAILPDPKIKMALQQKLNGPVKEKKNNIPLMAAASLALLFLLTTFFLYNKWQDTETTLDLIQSQTLSMQERIDALERNNQLTNDYLTAINGPNTIPLVLVGNQLAPDSRAVAYVNHKDRYVMVNALGLSKLPKDQTYQIWSDVDGEMINMGLLNTEEELIPVTYIDKAESLNITIEPAGGSEHPTVEKLISAVTF